MKKNVAGKITGGVQWTKNLSVDEITHIPDKKGFFSWKILQKNSLQGIQRQAVIPFYVVYNNLIIIIGNKFMPENTMIGDNNQ
ncbi:MAG: hypothetical protein EHM49_04960 [Deltaproteobacteria bacterium]|nr:MAG: hypothetical protein EHM49_04960 [Deltaproteobacteria bacterium]